MLTLQPADELMSNRALENAGSENSEAAQSCELDKSFWEGSCRAAEP